MFVLRRVPISAFLGSKNSTVSCGVRAARQVAALQTPSLLEGEIFHPALDFTKEKIETQPILPDRLVVGLESTSSLVLPVQQQQQQLDRKSIIKDPKKKIAGKKITTHYTASEQLDDKILRCLDCQDIRNKKTVYCVVNPGKSRLVDSLIQRGANRILVLEGSPDFVDVWKLKCDSLRTHSSCDVDFHHLNFDRLAAVAVGDFHRKQDSLANVFDRVPHVSWDQSNDPPMCIIGTIKPTNEKSLFLHLLSTRCFKSSIWRYGPCELLLFVSATKAAVLLNGADGSFPKCHSKHTFLRHKLYRMMFDVEKVLAEPKESFEPSINMRKGLLPLIEQQKLNLQKMYLLRIKPKRSLPDGLDEECLFQHWFFQKQIAFNKGTTKVLEFIENWFPHCSARLNGFEIAQGSDVDENLMLKELSFEEATRIFVEIRRWDEYESSTFMVEAERFAENCITMLQVVKDDV